MEGGKALAEGNGSSSDIRGKWPGKLGTGKCFGARDGPDADARRNILPSTSSELP
jgi:hypothetical protein